MPLFLQILEGESPAEATPIVATRDREIIASVARALASRLGMHDEGGRILALVRDGAPAKRRPAARAKPEVGDGHK